MMRRLSDKEMKKVLLDILIYIDDFCKREGIAYSLDGGTLLGAVRHKGFIPWDDDIDICMLRPEYERFKKIFSSLSHPFYKLQSYDVNGYPVPYVKVSDERTWIEERNVILPKKGINVDIFPIDFVPSDPKENEAAKDFNWSLSAQRFWKIQALPSPLKFRSWLRVLKWRIKLAGVSAVELCRRIDEDASNPAHKGSGVLCNATMRHYKNPMYLEQWLENYVKIPFEGHLFTAFSEYGKILEALYGDYMQLPPEGERICHKTVAYDLQSE